MGGNFDGHWLFKYFDGWSQSFAKHCIALKIWQVKFLRSGWKASKTSLFPPIKISRYTVYSLTTFITDAGLTIGAVVGGILLVIIIVLLLIIIILLYRNKRSKGRLDINDTSVAYKASDLDLSANVVIKPNPSFHKVKWESNVYSPGTELEPAYDEIGGGSLIMRNPKFSTEDKNNEYDYVISAEDLLATVKWHNLLLSTYSCSCVSIPVALC